MRAIVYGYDQSNLQSAASNTNYTHHVYQFSHQTKIALIVLLALGILITVLFIVTGSNHLNGSSLYHAKQSSILPSIGLITQKVSNNIRASVSTISQNNDATTQPKSDNQTTIQVNGQTVSSQNDGIYSQTIQNGSETTHISIQSSHSSTSSNDTNATNHSSTVIAIGTH